MSLSCQRQRRRRNLWRANPHCHWCGCLTVLPEDLSSKTLQKQPPANMATLDHLYTRLTGMRYLTQHWANGVNTVLACTRCNKERNQQEEREVGIDELRRRAGQADRFALSP